MNCKECYKYLGEYVDRTLVDGVAVEVEAHLKVCPECASFAAELDGVTSLMRSAVREGAPAGFEERLTRVLRRKEESKPGLLERLIAGIRPETYGPRRSLRPALAAVLLTAVVGTSLMFTGYYPGGGAGSTDFAYINAVRQQHSAFASANPLSDESALILNDRMKEIKGSL